MPLQSAYPNNISYPVNHTPCVRRHPKVKPRMNERFSIVERSMDGSEGTCTHVPAPYNWLPGVSAQQRPQLLPGSKRPFYFPSQLATQRKVQRLPIASPLSKLPPRSPAYLARDNDSTISGTNASAYPGICRSAWMACRTAPSGPTAALAMTCLSCLDGSTCGG